ncbi:MAG: hypothetical protein DWQ44_05340 [Bacteroidetes bacterium]|nr:MAG: hypothetical protein DWQ33_11990 [Bacteroidota bacterium]REK00797.1 MAG: hypothetical protein DWQ39_11660 [Bacteroidota bacterium]REK35045.1 MAG: hypothetical protein DWQ44_05340 [Bacteroidota bacterium]REK48156.1 MAG: hypothetical protein DWQ48_10005 [Bacteroidota bacterium]
MIPCWLASRSARNVSGKRKKRQCFVDSDAADINGQTKKKQTLTGGHTYNLNNLAGHYRLTFLPTRQPNASCFNFFSSAQKILKFYGNRTFGIFAFARFLFFSGLGKSK